MTRGKRKPQPPAPTPAPAPAPAPAPTPAPAPAPTPTPTGYDAATFAASLGFRTLVPGPSDEFNGPAGAKPDSTKWDSKTYTSSVSGIWWNGMANAQLDGQGHLDIVAKRGTSGWYSSELSGKIAYQGSRLIVARMKLPAGAGAWPAFWELDYPYGSGGIELDVCEQLGSKEPNVYHTTLHKDSGTEASYGVDAGVLLAGGDWHDYAAAVFDSHIDFYIDGRLLKTIVEPWDLEFDTTQRCLLIDLDMGGSWAGPIDPTLTELHLYVDFARVYMP